MNVDYGLREEHLPVDYSLRMERRNLEETMDEVLPNEVVDLVGWSTGGTVALEYCLQNPDRVRTLTLIEPGAFWVLFQSHDPWLERAKDLSDRMYTDVTEDQLAEFIQMASVTPEGTDPRTMERWPIWMKYRRSLLGMGAELSHRDDPERLKDLQTRTLLVKGTDSVPVLHAVIDELARRLPDCEVIELPSGHAPHLVSMDRFLELFEDFVRRSLRSESHKA